MLPRKSSRRRLRWVLGVLLLAALLAGGYAAWRYHGPCDSIEIYRGVTYSCLRLPSGNESGGLVHLIRADLNAPGVELYVTPLDANAISHGWQYRLQYVSTVVRDQHLATGVNGTLFDADSGWVHRRGDLARSLETVVADHVTSHVGAETYLLWWDDDRIAHLETTKPPSAAVLAKARWAIGGQQAVLVNGVVNPWANHAPDGRTMIAADPERRLVWLGVFDRASYRVAAQTLAEQGATIGVIVDGGTSCAMALGGEANGVRSGTVTGNWRPVATVFGVRADPRR
jgi:hypothetical protein